MNISDSGILNINKPLGWTSSRVVSRIKKIIKNKKVGHCGTLDPRAGGVLLICFGKATRLSSQFMNLKKTYKGIMRLGITTDSGDLDGNITSLKKPVSADLRKIEAVFQKFTGTITQVPPMYSAVKVRGEELYKKARRGEIIDRPARSVTIYKLDVLAFHNAEIEFRCECSKGTYIRTLVEDIGKHLGCGAVLASLVRKAVGTYTVNNALSWENVMLMSREDLLKKVS